MNINIGKIYENKTKKYLLPVLQGYGSIFIKKFSNLFKLAYGVKDDSLLGTDIYNKDCIYILVDSAYRNDYFKDFLLWFRDHESYVLDYPYDNIKNTQRKHMLVVKVPEQFKNTYTDFINGRYSKMYSIGDLNILFKNSLEKFEKGEEVLKIKDYEVLSKTGEIAKEGHRDFIKKEFNVKLNNRELRNVEWDVPPICNEEIFNNSQKTYFISKLKLNEKQKLNSH